MLKFLKRLNVGNQRYRGNGMSVFRDKFWPIIGLAFRNRRKRTRETCWVGELKLIAPNETRFVHIYNTASVCILLYYRVVSFRRFREFLNLQEPPSLLGDKHTDLSSLNAFVTVSDSQRSTLPPLPSSSCYCCLTAFHLSVLRQS